MKQKFVVIDGVFDSERETLSLRVNAINGACIKTFDNTTDLLLYLEDEFSFIEKNEENESKN